MHTGDNSRKLGPWVDIETAFSLYHSLLFAIHDGKVEAELLLHLLSPLGLQRGGGDDENAANTSLDDEFRKDQPCFNGLA